MQTLALTPGDKSRPSTLLVIPRGKVGTTPTRGGWTPTDACIKSASRLSIPNHKLTPESLKLCVIFPHINQDCIR